MHELTGVLSGSIGFLEDGKPILQFAINERMAAFELIDEYIGREKLSIRVDKYREKRSLNANNYAWKLITEIGNKLRMSKDDVYLLMLKRYGQSEMVSVLSGVPFGKFVKYFDEVGESELKGKMFTHYRVYQGSSEFDKQQMSIFIDGIVSEAKDLGIPTETPDELARLKSLWGE